MDRGALEKILLDKLEKGLLDGVVGDDFASGKSLFRKVIIDGVPKTLKLTSGKKYFDNKENVRPAGKVLVHAVWETKEKMLEFIARFGWLMKDPDAQAYSALFKKK